MRGLHGQMPRNSELIYFTRFFPEGQEGSAFSFTILFHHSLSPFSLTILFHHSLSPFSFLTSREGTGSARTARFSFPFSGGKLRRCCGQGETMVEWQKPKGCGRVADGWQAQKHGGHLPLPGRAAPADVPSDRLNDIQASAVRSRLSPPKSPEIERFQDFFFSFSCLN